MTLPPRFRAALSILRPAQAYKAAVVWLPSLFFGHGALRLHMFHLLRITVAWILLSQLVYLFNDLRDLEQDRLDPARCQRPLASGALAPRHAWAMIALGLLALGLILSTLGPTFRLWCAAYALMNITYSLGLKKHVGVRQALIAIGFWIRLQSGGEPELPIPITIWASMFTLGLAYYLNSLKGLGKMDQADPSQRWASAFGAMLSGSLALVALTTLSIKRSTEGTIAHPELPPLACLVGMHRFAHRSFFQEAVKEQAWAVFRDPVTLVAMLLFLVSMAWR